MPDTATLDHRLESARAALDSADQSHVLQFWDKLDDAQRDTLLSQVEAIDWAQIARLVESHVRNKPDFSIKGTVEPAPWYPYDPNECDAESAYAEARKLGEQLVRDGKVAAFTVAGGQGTRLGYDGPKGMYPATPIRNTPLFGLFAEYLRKVKEKFGHVIPWYIMTSQVNDAATREYFDDQEFFGLEPEDIMFFSQAMLPAFDMDTGKVLLDASGSLALSPNGHGGSLQALRDSGALDDMQQRGVEQISYFQVDNPLVKCIDPLFIGLHARDGAQMSSKALPKAGPAEKVGVFAKVDGRISVIEYSDLPDELAEVREPNGDLRFKAGSIAIHVIAVDFVKQLGAGESFGLPFHRAEKKVAHVDLESGSRVEPQSPNAVKLEMFVFDALPLCETSIVYETERVEEFAPIKNADEDGAVDCPATSHALQSKRAARWLEANGVLVPHDDNDQPEATLEVGPLTAIEPTDLADQALPDMVAPGARLVF